MASLTLPKLAKLIKDVEQHPRLKDLTNKKHQIFMPTLGHELYTKVFVIFVGCNDLLLNQYTTANYSAIETLKNKYGIDVQVIGKHRVKASLMLSKGRFTFT